MKIRNGALFINRGKFIDWFGAGKANHVKQFRRVASDKMQGYKSVLLLHFEKCLNFCFSAVDQSLAVLMGVM